MKKNKDFGSVINAVEAASDKELAALADISNKLEKISGIDTPAPAKSDEKAAPQKSTIRQDPVPRSVRAMKREATEKQAKPHEKNNDNAKLRQSKSIITNGKEASLPATALPPLETQDKTKESTTENHQNTEITNNTTINHQNDNKKSSKKEVQNHYKTAVNPVAGSDYVDRNGQLRDVNGRFKTSSKEAAEKSRQEAAAGKSDKAPGAEHRRRAAWLREISDPLDNDKVNEAGQAVGSTFWRSGKEIYDVGKSAVTGTAEGLGKIRTLGQVNEEGQNAKRGFLSRLRKPRQQNSQDAVARNMARDQEKSIQEQTEAIKEGDEEIIDRLDQLLKEQGKKSGGGLMSSLLGGTALAAAAKAAGKWGKGAAIAAGAAALGGLKGIYNKVRRKPKPAVSGSSKKPEDIDKKGKPNSKPEAKTPQKGEEKVDKAKPKASDQARGQPVEQAKDKTSKTAAGSEEKKAGKAAGKKASESAGKTAAKKGLEEAGEVAGKKLGFKALAKTALKFTGVGTLLSSIWDAGEGYSDEDAQKKVYGTQELTHQQKASYAAASVLSLGGLGDIASEYVGKGARWMGLDGVADTVEKYNSAEMAISINNTLGKVTDYFSSEKKEQEVEKNNQADVIDAIDKGAKSTTTEVKAGFSGLLDFLKNPVDTVKQMAAGTYNFSSEHVPPIEKALSAEGRKNLDALDGHFRMLEQRDGLPANTLRTIATIESSGNPNAVGKMTKYGRAKGMFQLVDDTATDLGLSGKDVFDPAKAADGASRYIKFLLKENNGDLTKAIAAYNWGIGNVQRQGMENMPEETRDYVAKFHAYSAVPVTQGMPAVTMPGQPPAPSAAQDIAAIAGQGSQGMPGPDKAPAPGQQVNPVPMPGDVSHGQKNSDDQTFTHNGQTYRKASLPADKLDKDSAVGEMATWGVEQLGGEHLRIAEGMRHQVSAPDVVQHAQAARAPAAQNVKPLPAGDFVRAGNGEIYRRAELPSDKLSTDTMYGQVADWVVDNLGGDKLRDAEGMRHQAVESNGEGSLKAAIAARATGTTRQAPGQIGVEDDGTPIVRASMVGRAITARPQTPTAQMPAKPMVVTDYSASNVKPPVSLGDQSFSLDDEARKILTSMNGLLKKIAGYTEDTAKSSGKQAPNTPATAQPQPRSSIPLELSDPQMQEFTQD